MSANRTQQRYDHRLLLLVRDTGDASLATRLGVPRSTASGWLRRSLPEVTTASILDELVAALHLRIAKLEGRVERLAGALRILFALMRTLSPDLSYVRIEVGGQTAPSSRG